MENWQKNALAYIGDAIEKSGLSQRAFAKKVGVTPNHLNLVINGHREVTRQLIASVAAYLNVGTSELNEYQAKPAPRPPEDLTEAYKEINSIIGGLGPDDIRLALNALRDIASTPTNITPPTIDEDEAARPVRRR